ncbi:hypothetical protein BN7874_016 [Phage NCTB]|jgi:hypothetical protein|nr:hypothetical protein BN7874_016 [Phage NCTB]
MLKVESSWHKDEVTVVDSLDDDKVIAVFNTTGYSIKYPKDKGGELIAVGGARFISERTWSKFVSIVKDKLDLDIPTDSFNLDHFKEQA